jgi:hypothetical protein
VRATPLAWIALVLPLGAAPISAGDRHLPLGPSEAGARLANDAFQIVAVEPAPSGVAGALKLTLRFPEDGFELRAKWKAAPGPDGEGWNNVPRKEIAAFAVQLFLVEPADYVVPPVAARCIPLADYAIVDPRARPTFSGTSCVFGALSAWLSGVRQVERVIDRERFDADPLYARRAGTVNLLGHLIQHRDGRSANFLISSDEGDPRVFSVDNGIAFGGYLFNFFVPNLSKLRVPAIPRTCAERLKATSRDDVHQLGVLAQFALDERRVFAPVERTANLDPSRGTRRAGDVLQIGLTRQELEALDRRIDRVLLDVAEARIALR